ncbi:MFS transporter [Streptomyces sp. NBC_01795]|uniref:MFS transporter n=1 Tax=Streptomyces sp. NBC_01795 TaxID=2975943 RepID=UPI002DD9C073|nr:MFS transporter [Streptomyces sp. NBC_01795]WSA91826.1 MFS transporter [Streptomyces sp. NBC_01795]
MRAYLATAALARLADEGMALALTLLALERTGSAAQGAYVLTAWMAPHVAAAPVAGALAERARRPRLFYGAALAVFATAIALLGVLLGRAPTALTLTVAVAGGSCGPVVTGGLSSLLTGLASRPAARTRVYALDAATYNAASVTAPAAVSAVALTLTPALATTLLAASAACAALLTPALPLPSAHAPGPWRAPKRKRPAEPPQPPPQPPPEPESESDSGPPPPPESEPEPPPPPHPAPPLRVRLTTGLLALWRIPPLRAITAATSVAFLGVGGLPVTSVLLAAEAGDAGGGGLLMTVFALGALSGAVALARRPPRIRPEQLAALSLFSTGAALAGAAAVPSFAAAVALFALAGVGDGPLLSTTLRIRADHAPAAAHTQVFTLGAGLKQSAAAAGAALAGAASGLPPPLLLLTVAALQLAGALLLRLSCRKRDRPPP